MKIGILTGGTGAQFAEDIIELLCNKEKHIVILSRSKSKLQNSLERYKEKKFNVSGYETDYSEKSLSEIIDLIDKKYKKIDFLINNAATAKLKNVEDVSINDWNEVLYVNLTMPMILSRLVSKTMIKNKNGSIVNISSIYGSRAPKHFIYGDSNLNSPLNYGVSKAGLEQMTRYLASYWAPFIRVNCVVAGGRFNNQEKKFVRNYIKNTPLQRMANKDDIGGLVNFLCSNQASYITGQNIHVDGGWSIW